MGSHGWLPAARRSAIAASAGVEDAVRVEVAFLRRNASPWLYERVSVNAVAAGDRMVGVADAVVVGVVVASGAGVPLVGAGVIGVVVGVVSGVVARMPQVDTEFGVRVHPSNHLPESPFK